MEREIKRVHQANFHVAGFSYWDGCEAFENLKIPDFINASPIFV